MEIPATPVKCVQRSSEEENMEFLHFHQTWSICRSLTRTSHWAGSASWPAWPPATQTRAHCHRAHAGSPSTNSRVWKSHRSSQPVTRQPSRQASPARGLPASPWAPLGYQRQTGCPAGPQDAQRGLGSNASVCQPQRGLTTQMSAPPAPVSSWRPPLSFSSCPLQPGDSAQPHESDPHESDRTWAPRGEGGRTGPLLSPWCGLAL